LFALLAFLYAPVRLVQAANPVWTLVSWGLALVVIGLTLWFLRLALPSPSWREGDRRSDEVTSPSPLWGEGGRRPDEVFPLSAVQRCRFSDFIFPIGFFLVAVPWPSVIEGPLIQGLTRADARVTVELLGWLGIPALPHGNVIQVATGEVGIDEACSGIRSFQATLMISLFLGELYRLSGVRRAALCLGGFAMSFLFNLARMSLLVWVAASKGIAAIAAWHDPAGVTILVACFGGLWALAVWLRQAPSAEHPAPPSPKSAPSTRLLQPSTFNPQLLLPPLASLHHPSSIIPPPSSPRLAAARPVRVDCADRDRRGKLVSLA
jgi:exosortase/archaeosortase family protein